MTFANLSRYSSEPNIYSSPSTRPKFNHQNTGDRLREGSGRPSSFFMVSKIRKDRKSIFKEIGLDTDVAEEYRSEKEFGELTGLSRSTTFENISERGYDEKERRGSRSSQEDPFSPQSPTSKDKAWYSKLVTRRPRIKTVPSAPPATVTSMSRFTAMALIIGVALPGLSYYNGHGVDAGLIRRSPRAYGSIIDVRADSPAQVCTRWSQQSKELYVSL